MESEKWKISDFVMIGILSAVYGAVTLGIGMLTATVNPFLHLFSPAIIAIILGTVVLFVVKKINKFGALTLFITVSIVLFSGFSGMFYLPLVGVVAATVLVLEIIIKQMKYSIFALAIGYGVIQSSYIFGGCIPVLFFLDQNILHWQEAGMDAQTIENFVKYSSGWYLAIGMLGCFIAGIIGIYIGKGILKKHIKEIS